MMVDLGSQLCLDKGGGLGKENWAWGSAMTVKWEDGEGVLPCYA